MIDLAEIRKDLEQWPDVSHLVAHLQDDDDESTEAAAAIIGTHAPAMLAEIVRLTAQLDEAKRLGADLAAALPEHARDCGLHSGRIDTCTCHAATAAALEAL